MDLRIEGGPGGLLQYADVVVHHAVQGNDSLTQANANADGAEARRAEAVKYARYGRAVLPLALETFGRWGPAALRWWRLLARHVADNDPQLSHLGHWAMANLLSSWWARVSIALQTQNAMAQAESAGIRRPVCRSSLDSCPVDLLLPRDGAA